jgi:uncharacterized protein
MSFADTPLTPTNLAFCSKKLREMLDNVPATFGAFLATDDGFELTQQIAGKEFEASRLAAMSSSMVALSHALAGEIDLGETENLLIEAKLGKILMLGINTTPKLCLTVIAKPSATLGNVLVHAKICAEAIRRILSPA